MRTPSFALTLILLIALGLPAASSAQDAGVKGGVSFASLPINLADGNIYTGRLHAGFAGGGFVVFPVGKSLHFETDALIVQKGTRDASEHINLTYLDVPVLLRFVEVAYGHSVLHAYIGPSFAFKIGASDNLGALSRTVFGGDVDSHTKSFDPGLTIGGDASGKHIVGDFRYTWGFADIRNLTTKNGTVKNRALTVMIGWRFGG